MHHADATLGAQVDLGLGQLGHVHRGQVFVHQAQALQPAQRPLPVLRHGIGDLLRGLAQRAQRGTQHGLLVGVAAAFFEPYADDEDFREGFRKAKA